MEPGDDFADLEQPQSPNFGEPGDDIENETFEVEQKTEDFDADKTFEVNVNNMPQNETFEVAAQNETIEISAQNETIEISAQNEALKVPSQNATFEITAQNETLEGTAQNETINVPDTSTAQNETFEISTEQKTILERDLPPSPPPSDPISENIPDSSENAPEEAPPPKGAYSMDFEKFDDPNFNPFATKKAMQNSPPSSPTPKIQNSLKVQQVCN